MHKVVFTATGLNGHFNTTTNEAMRDVSNEAIETVVAQIEGVLMLAGAVLIVDFHKSHLPPDILVEISNAMIL